MPRIINDYEFTEKHEEAIGQLVTDYWGANIQTGFAGFENKVPYIYFQMGPNTEIMQFYVDPDGTVTRIGK